VSVATAEGGATEEILEREREKEEREGEVGRETALPRLLLLLFCFDAFIFPLFALIFSRKRPKLSKFVCEREESRTIMAFKASRRRTTTIIIA